CQQHDDSPLTF
nr:immunoglobulin light chain junction region [Macaca mulatta]MOV94179.1 immunoglobulin light chain junction region [Macaca mulatta]